MDLITLQTDQINFKQGCPIFKDCASLQETFPVTNRSQITFNIEVTQIFSNEVLICGLQKMFFVSSYNFESIIFERSIRKLFSQTSRNISL